MSVAEICGSAPNIRVRKKPNMLKDVKARYFVVQDYIMLRLFSISKLLIYKTNNDISCKRLNQARLD